MMAEQTQSQVRIVVNGQPISIAPRTTVADLLSQLNIGPRGVAVEVNLEVQPRDQLDTRQLKAGDSLEIVTLVGGG